MEEPTHTPSMNVSIESPNDGDENAESSISVPSPVQNLRMFTRYEDSASSGMSAAMVEPDQYIASDGTKSPKSCNPTSIPNKPSDEQHHSRKGNAWHTTFWKTAGIIIGFFLIGQYHLAHSQTPTDSIEHSSLL
jgi:hypothetical protein